MTRMRPDDKDVQEMVLALFTIVGGIQRATRRSPAASRLTVLQVIETRPGMRPSEIAAELDVNQSSVTRHIQALKAKGLVTVKADPQDGRAYTLQLTDSGRDELAELTQIGLQRFASFVADWDAEEVRTLTRLLVKFEESKAEVGQRETPPSGRRWKQTGD
jgi:DNA-binding MarR family transcriptional regulator